MRKLQWIFHFLSVFALFLTCDRLFASDKNSGRRIEAQRLRELGYKKKAQDDSRWSGVIVRFKDFEGRDRFEKSINDKSNVRVQSRSKDQPEETIELVDEQKNGDKYSLEKLCKEYLKFPDVTECEFNEK